MAYNKASQFPDEFHSKTDLSNTPVHLGSGKKSVAWAVLIGGAADEEVIFRSQDGTTATFFTVKLPSGAILPLAGFKADPDLEVVTSNSAGDVGYVIAVSSLG